MTRTLKLRLRSLNSYCSYEHQSIRRVGLTEWNLSHKVQGELWYLSLKDSVVVPFVRSPCCHPVYGLITSSRPVCPGRFLFSYYSTCSPPLLVHVCRICSGNTAVAPCRRLGTSGCITPSLFVLSPTPPDLQIPYGLWDQLGHHLGYIHQVTGRTIQTWLLALARWDKECTCDTSKRAECAKYHQP